MPQLSAAKRLMLAANSQQFPHVRENLLLFASSPGFCERVVRVLGPSSGKIAPVIGIAASRHANFVAVVQFRNATQGQRQSEGQLQLDRKSTRLNSSHRCI